MVKVGDPVYVLKMVSSYADVAVWTPISLLDDEMEPFSMA